MCIYVYFRYVYTYIWGYISMHNVNFWEGWDRVDKLQPLATRIPILPGHSYACPWFRPLPAGDEVSSELVSCRSQLEQLPRLSKQAPSCNQISAYGPAKPIHHLAWFGAERRKKKQKSQLPTEATAHLINANSSYIHSLALQLVSLMHTQRFQPCWHYIQAGSL